MALCKAIITMSHQLGIKVVAEGIECEQQHDLLLAAGCDYGQGHFLFEADQCGAIYRLAGKS